MIRIATAQTGVLEFMKRFFFLTVLALAMSPIARAQATDTRVIAALKLVDLGNAREAADNLRQLTTAEPKNAEAHAGLALALTDLNDLNTALTEAQAGFDIDRKNILVRIARGTVYGKQGRKDDALSEFRQAVKLNDKDLGSQLALSRYFITIDSLKSAEITLYRAQQMNSTDVRSFIGLAELYERQHIQELAIGQYEQAKKIDPKDVTVHAKLAGLYYRTRKYNESAKEWLKIIETDSTYPDAYYQVGNLYFLAKQYPNAANFAQRYVRLRPNDVYGQWLLARSLTEIGQYQEAMAPLQAVAANDSLRSLSQLLLARSYFYSKDYPKALDIFKNAKSLSPQDLSFYGTTLVVSGDTAGGIEQMKKSLVNDTVRTAQQKRETQNAIVGLLYKQKKYDEAGDFFAGLAQSQPSVEWYVSAGQAYAAAKKADLAQQNFQKALALDPNSMKIQYQIAFASLETDASADASRESFEKLLASAKAANNADTTALAEGFLGYHYAAKKDWQKSIDHAEVAVKSLESTTSPFRVSFNLLLGQAYHQLHKFDDAKKYYKKTLELDPANKGAKEGLDYLAGAPNEATPTKKKGK